MAQQPTTRDAILELLRLHPEGMTTREIAEDMKRPLGGIQSTIRNERMRRGSENFRIGSYQRSELQTGLSSPVYVVGPGPDAKRPPTPPDSIQQSKARWRDRNRLICSIKDRASREGAPNPFAQLLARR